MAAKEPEKLAIFYILKAPENHSCYEKRYSQSQIIDLVYDDYGMKLDRKTIRRNLSKLLEVGFPLKYEEHHRTNKKGQQENILTNWYALRNTFTTASNSVNTLFFHILKTTSMPFSSLT